MDEIVKEFLVESHENLDQLNHDLVALENEPRSHQLLSRVFRTIHTIKGTCGFLGFSRLENLTHAGESILSDLRDGRRAMDQPTTDLLLRMVDTVREILASIEASGTEGDIDVDAVIEQIRTVMTDPATQTAPDWEAPAAGTEQVADEPEPLKVSDSAIRVDVNVLDDLMRQVGELVLARNQLTRLVGGQLDADLIRASQRLSMIASELQEGVMQARMQPIGHLWAQMPRVVRDLAASCGRKVHLEVVGGDIELDRALLEAVKDPLIHMVRNAVDHGIEDAQTRLAVGKPAAGVLTIRAYQAGGQVVVEVEDDGRGIDLDRVAAAAVTGGIRTPDEIASLGESDLLRLVFLPGFSTAGAVTNVSGRGVGLDVVHTRIERIGGTVEVESTIGLGTTLRLRIPLTLAIISAIVVESAGELYSIPTVNVREFLSADGESTDATVEYAGNAPLLRLRGTLLPLVALRDVLGLPAVFPSGDHPGPRSPTVIAVLQADTRRFGLIVDRVLDTEEIVVKSLTARLRGVGVYAGATLLGDGRVSLILDVQGIARKSLTSQSTQAEQEPGEAPPVSAEASGQVLVVGIGDERRVAIPLESVIRLEQVHGDAVEHLGGREVLQYRQAVIPLIRLGRVLGVRTQPPTGDLEPQELHLVILTLGTHTVAVAIETVLDIMVDDPARHAKIEDGRVCGSTVLADRVTELIDLRQVVGNSDPSFFDDSVRAADDSAARNPDATLDAVEV
jgi:two-component system chemotaxis sensor kinase CheA